VSGVMAAGRKAAAGALAVCGASVSDAKFIRRLPGSASVTRDDGRNEWRVPDTAAHGNAAAAVYRDQPDAPAQFQLWPAGMYLCTMCSPLRFLSPPVCSRAAPTLRHGLEDGGAVWCCIRVPRSMPTPCSR
jgi:hypothetical protein